MLSCTGISMKSQKLKGFANGLPATVITLLILETIARIGFTFFQDIRSSPGQEANSWFNYTPDTGWERKPNFNGTMPGTAYLPPVSRQFDSEGLNSADTPQVGDSSKPMVLFLGDSNTFGLSLPVADTFVEQVDSLLPHINAINLGVIGYTSFQGVKLFEKQGLLYKPDILVVSFNFNDRRYMVSPDAADSGKHFAAVHRQKKMQAVTQKLDYIYIYKGLQILMQKTGLLAKRTGRSRMPLSDLTARVEPDRYRRNLETLAELCKKNGVQLIFMILKDNPIQATHLKEGILLYKSGKIDQAIEKLHITYVNNDAFVALAQKYLHLCYKARGWEKEAERAQTVSNPFVSSLGGLPLYTDEEYNDIMQKVGHRYGAQVLDAGSVMQQFPEDYIDYCHLNANGHKKVAALLADVIDKLLHKNTGEQAAP